MPICYYQLTSVGMQLLTPFQSLRKWPMMPDVGVPVLVTALLWYFSSNDVTLLETGAALLLGWLPWASYRNWCRGERKGIPLFALIAGMYWIAYVLPLFWGTHEIGLVTGAGLFPNGRLPPRST